MADPYRQVRPGEDVEFSAAAWNAMLDAARAAKGPAAGRADAAPGRGRQADVVLVRNDSGGGLARASVLGLGGPAFSPADSEDAFLREVCFKGVTPTADHLGKFCVLLEPAPAGRVARAYVAGVCPVLVDVGDPDDASADVAAGSAAHLLSSPSGGSAQILWKEADDAYTGYYTGVQWALVRLGTPPPAVRRATAGASGIPAGGSAAATLANADGSTTAATVYNWFATAVPASKKMMVAWVDGAWYVLSWDC